MRMPMWATALDQKVTPTGAQDFSKLRIICSSFTLAVVHSIARIAKTLSGLVNVPA